MKTLRSKMTLLTLAPVVAGSIIMNVIGFMTLNKLMTNYSETMMFSMAEEQKASIDNVSENLEHAANILKTCFLQEVTSVESLRDAAALQKYEHHAEGVMLNLAENTRYADSLYIRFNPKYAGGKAGVFYTRDHKNNSWIKAPLTDLGNYENSDSKELAWWLEPVRSKKPAWVTPHVDNVLKEETISYCIPVYIGNDFAGVIGVDTKVSVLAKFLKEIEIYKTGSSFLTNKNQYIIYHPEEEDPKVRLRIDRDSKTIADVLTKNEDSKHLARYTNPDAEKIALAEKELACGLHLVVSAREKEIYAERDGLISKMMMVMLAISLGLLFVVKKFVDKLVAPIHNLIQASDLISRGDINGVTLEDKPSDDEIGQLQASLKRTMGFLREHLDHVNTLAYSDLMTGVKNRTAYLEKIQEINQEIKNGAAEFAVVVFDINNLKKVNDTLGHEQGDQLIKEASKLICSTFKGSSVYRIGGDEFVVISKGEDYINRNKLIESFKAKAINRTNSGKKFDLVVACGMSVYNRKDIDYEYVFNRADEDMYDNKQTLKELNKVVVSEVNTRRKILIIEDDAINQEMLSCILEDKYDILTAENGAVGMEVLRNNHNDLSLVMLDVYMPVCDGFQFLEMLAKDTELSDVPVIVTTGSEDPKDEVACLKMGACDFVTKPYNAEIVLARVDNIIDMKESVTALSVVEHDPLTGMYTMQAFGHKVQQLLRKNPDKHFDMLLVDIEDFKLVNDVFGEEVGDKVLTDVARGCSSVIPSFIEARDGDKFYFLCDCFDEIKDTFIDRISDRVNQNVLVTSLKIKYGVYHDIDNSLSVSILCDRVRMTVEKIKHSYNENLAFYDKTIRENRLEKQKLQTAFGPALKNGEFVTWYQPKVDSNTGKIMAAEALVRWIPENGQMISPGKFIPLFEQNGQIADLDECVFEQVCRLQGERLAAGLKTVPISINLSRHSIYRKGIVERYCAIAEQYKVPFNLIPIELTESAATEIKVVQGLVDNLIEAGFELHMDDFGTGYSSVSALASLPFSVVKLDKSLIDQIGNTKGEVVLKSLVNAVHAIGMKLVAEGVEHKEQIDFLKSIECYCIQGYYYSPPKNQQVFVDILNTDKDMTPA